eukprot:gene9346-10331_t
MLKDESKAGEIAHERNESLSKKVKKMRDGLEVSETVVAGLIAKYRKCQAEHDDTEDHAEAEAMLMRASVSRSSSMPQSRSRSRAISRTRTPMLRFRSPAPKGYYDKFESTASSSTVESCANCRNSTISCILFFSFPN